MSLLIHPNVMPLIGLCFDEEMPLLIMPFMSKGNVLEYVRQNEMDLHKDQEASEVEVYILQGDTGNFEVVRPTICDEICACAVYSM